MKTLNYFCILILLSFPVVSIFGQTPDTLWTRSIGDEGTQIAYAVFQTDDGGFMIGGYTTTSGWFDYYLVKADSEGNVVWEKNYGEEDRSESANWMIETNDGGYILAGGRADDPPYSSNTDIFLVKTDGEGNEEWSSIIGVDDISETPNCIVQTLDGGYVVCGHYWASSQTGYDIFLVKTNSLGLEEWTQVINFEDGMADRAMAITLADDGGFLVTGETQAFSTNYDDNAYILKTNDLGEFEWLQTYGNAWPWYESGYHIMKASDGGFLICGQQNNDGIDKNWYVVKTDGSGNQIWSNNVIGGTYHDIALASCETFDGGYAVTGSYHQDVWNPFIAKYNIEGDTTWTKMWSTGNDNSQYNYAIKQLDDGGFITAGSTAIPGGDVNIYLSRIEPEVVSTDSPDWINSSLNIEMFDCHPNPFSYKSIISYQLTKGMFLNLSIYNMYGHKIKELTNNYQDKGIHQLEFNPDQIGVGIYFCVLSTENGILTRKLIIQ